MLNIYMPDEKGCSAVNVVEASFLHLTYRFLHFGGQVVDRYGKILYKK